MALPGSKVSHIGQVVNPEGYAYNEVGLLQKLEEILLPADYPWVESLSVTVRDSRSGSILCFLPMSPCLRCVHMYIHQVEDEVQVESADDDLKREAALYAPPFAFFCVLICCIDGYPRVSSSYQHARAGVKQAIQLLRQGKTPYQRPDDYFAEMVKTDAHMAKVRALIFCVHFLFVLSLEDFRLPYLSFGLGGMRSDQELPRSRKN
jgi:hypothetical protein